MNRLKKIRGIGSSGGIAIGRLVIAGEQGYRVERVEGEDSCAELKRFEEARKQAESDLNRVYLDAVRRVGKESSMIFQLHIMMLQDQDYYEAIRDRIVKHGASAEYAVWRAARQFAAVFSSMEDEYMRGRAADVADISRRLLQLLDPHFPREYSEFLQNREEPCIMAVAGVVPSMMMQLDKKKISAILSREGSRSSHSAILARILGIPMVMALGPSFSALEQDQAVVLDGSTGWIFLDPDENTLHRYRRRRDSYFLHLEELQELRGTKAVTRSNRTLQIYASITRPEDIEEVLENDGDGVGLYRTEYYFMNREDYPDEEEQTRHYTAILEKLGGRPAVIRTLDAGADRQLPYMSLQEEDNPAMGYRAMRLSLSMPQILTTQMRALLRASAHGDLRVLLPMITTFQEVKQARELWNRAKESLRREKIPFDENTPLGIMIETPAAALTAGALAKEVDFFSIGTSDLTQFVTAADRNNPRVAYLYDFHHPAVLKLISMVGEAAREAGISFTVSGEAAGDITLTEFFLDCGAASLTVAPHSVLELRRAVQQLD